MKQCVTKLGLFVLLVLLVLPGLEAAAEPYEAIFAPDDHCVAYRVTKDMLFAKDVIVVGKSCEVVVSLVSNVDAAGPRIVVEVPIKSLKSGNILRNSSVSDILGAKTQPNLQFTSDPLDVEALRAHEGEGAIVVAGQLTIAGVDHAVSCPVEVLGASEQRYARCRLATAFADFGMEPPVAGGGLIARVHEDLDLLVHIDLARIEGLEDTLADGPPASGRLPSTNTESTSPPNP